MGYIEVYNNILTEDERHYLVNLIKTRSNWVWRGNYNDRSPNGGKIYFDSITPDYDKLKNYHKLICDGEKYYVLETAINIISKDRQNKNSFHYDECDLSFVTYLNEDFIGGNFNYYDDKNKKYSFKPKIDLTLKINKNVFHEVEEVTDGTRYSLYSFLNFNIKKNKTIL